jgi:hypothetical protein
LRTETDLDHVQGVPPVERVDLNDIASRLAEEYRLDFPVVMDVLRDDPMDIESCRAKLMMLAGHA